MKSTQKATAKAVDSDEAAQPPKHKGKKGGPPKPKGKKGGKWQGGDVIRTVYNDFHMSRNDFPLPPKWGKRPWHRKEIVPENERVV